MASLKRLLPPATWFAWSIAALFVVKIIPFHGEGLPHSVPNDVLFIVGAIVWGEAARRNEVVVSRARLVPIAEQDKLMGEAEAIMTKAHYFIGGLLAALVANGVLAQR